MLTSADRRVTRSRAAIQQALLERLRSESANEISIAGLAETANVTRNTIYKHFGSMDELLADTVDTVLTRFTTAVEDDDLRFPMDRDRLVGKILAAWGTDHDVWSVVLGNGLSSVVLQRIEARAGEFLERVAAVNAMTIENRTALEYLASHLTGSTVAVMSRWFRRGGVDDLTEQITMTMQTLPHGFAAIFTKE